VKALVEAKVNNLPVPAEEVPKPHQGKVINLMDALRKSLEEGERPGKKPPKSEKEPPGRKMKLVKGQSKAPTKRKSA
jgi:DNA end-binding protein Ku